jgi:cell division protein FtsA
LQHGAALVDATAKDRMLTNTNEIGLPLKSVNLGHLQFIMSLRLEEIFEIIALELETAGLANYLRAGIFLCGGTSRTPGIAQLAERVFQMNVTTGKAAAVNGLTLALDQPEFSTAIGLVKFGSHKKRERKRQRPIFHLPFPKVFKKFLQRA